MFCQSSNKHQRFTHNAHVQKTNQLQAAEHLPVQISVASVLIVLPETISTGGLKMAVV